MSRFCLFAEEEGGETLEEHRKRSRASKGKPGSWFWLPSPAPPGGPLAKGNHLTNTVYTLAWASSRTIAYV